MNPQHTKSPQSARETSQDDRQATIDRLQEIVRMLLIKNQTLRMGLSTETEKKKSNPVPTAEGIAGTITDS